MELGPVFDLYTGCCFALSMIYFCNILHSPLVSRLIPDGQIEHNCRAIAKTIKVM